MTTDSSKCPLCGGKPEYLEFESGTGELDTVLCECGLNTRPFSDLLGELEQWEKWEQLVAKFPPIMRAKIGDLIEACPYAGECNYESKKLYIHGVDREKNTVYVADVKPNKQGTLVGFSFFDTEMPAAYVDNWNLKEGGGEQ